MADEKKDPVKVVIRVRPPIAEDEADFENCVDLSHAADGCVTLVQPPFFRRDFQFQRVLGPDSTQEDVYDITAAPIVERVLEGYNGTILAYGQTGTGKTFTIFGRNSDWIPQVAPVDDEPPFAKCGIVPRMILHIFDAIAARTDTEFRVSVSFLQIHKEIVSDLLDPSRTGLMIRESKAGIYVAALSQVVVSNPAEVLDLIRDGAAKRATHSTLMNQASSRSHALLQITIEQRTARDAAVKRGVLTLVDLAGSERVTKTGSVGPRLQEACSINQSLLALGNVVSALTNGKTGHVPFRDSKLTRLLTDSLGGNTLTALIVCIGPSIAHFDEHLSSLRFATRATQVKNHATVNEVTSWKIIQRSLQEKVLELRQENTALQSELSSLKVVLEQLPDDLKHSLMGFLHSDAFELAMTDSTTPISPFAPEAPGLSPIQRRLIQISSPTRLETSPLIERSSQTVLPVIVPPDMSPMYDSLRIPPPQSTMSALDWIDRERQLLSRIISLEASQHAPTRQGDLAQRIVASLDRIPEIHSAIQGLGLDQALGELEEDFFTEPVQPIRAYSQDDRSSRDTQTLMSPAVFAQRRIPTLPVSFPKMI